MEEDDRREAAIASTACLNPKFRPSSSVSQARISKFQELHKRRLQIKEKSKTKNKSKGKSSGPSKLEENSHAVDKTNPVLLDNIQEEDVSSIPKDVPAKTALRKLHWGLDTKERWERKSNM